MRKIGERKIGRFFAAACLTIAPLASPAAETLNVQQNAAEIAELKQKVEQQQNQIDSLIAASGAERIQTNPQKPGDSITTATEPPTTKISYKALGATDPGEWAGFYRVPGTKTQYRFNGFIELDMLHDWGEIVTPTSLVTKEIVTSGSSRQGPAVNDDRTSYTVQASRISFETRTPLSGDGEQRITTFLAWDFFGDMTSATPQLELLEAYGKVNNLFGSGGDLLVGQYWTTFTDLYAVPGTLDYQGPNATFGIRHPMVRWTQHISNSFSVGVAVEAPDEVEYVDANGSYAISGSNVSFWPDGVVALHWEHSKLDLMLSGLVRDLKIRYGSDPVASAFGWGASLQGRVYMPEAFEHDFLMFMFTFGVGIGSRMNDAPPDAFFDTASNTLKPIPTAGAMLGYQHRWSKRTYSVATYGYLGQDTFDGQADTAYRSTHYATLNYCWTPAATWLVGGELAYGSREDRDGSNGTDIRTILTSRFNF